MLKQSMPLLLEQEGIKHTKLHKLPIGQNRRRYRVSYTLLLELSLSSQFLSAKDHIVNINLLYCDFDRSESRDEILFKGVGCDIPEF